MDGSTGSDIRVVLGGVYDSMRPRAWKEAYVQLVITIATLFKFCNEFDDLYPFISIDSEAIFKRLISELLFHPVASVRRH